MSDWWHRLLYAVGYDRVSWESRWEVIRGILGLVLLFWVLYLQNQLPLTDEQRAARDRRAAEYWEMDGERDM